MISLKQDNIEKLVEVGFKICPWEVMTRPFGGSSMVEKWDSGFHFYIGDDYAFGKYTFFQNWEDFRLIEDDILIMMLDLGLPLPDIDRDSGHEHHETGDMGVLYEVGFRGVDAGEIYGHLITARHYIQDAIAQIPPSEERSQRNFDLVAGRFVSGFNTRLIRIKSEEDSISIYTDKEKERKLAMIESFVQLIHAVRDNALIKYGSIIARIQSLSPLDYDPHPAIENILSGKYNKASHNSLVHEPI